MSPVEIVAALRSAAEILQSVDPFASISVSDQSEAIVREVASAAGVPVSVILYGDTHPAATVIVIAYVGAHTNVHNAYFAATPREATPLEIAAGSTPYVVSA